MHDEKISISKRVFEPFVQVYYYIKYVNIIDNVTIDNYMYKLQTFRHFGLISSGFLS